MKKCIPLTLGACGLTLALFLSGCGDAETPSVPTSGVEATVHGTVKVKGVLAKKGQVAFDPRNIKRKDAAVGRADIGADGTYTLKTLVGDNGVSVTTPAMAKDPKLAYFSKRFEVQAGENTYDIDVTPAGK